MSLIEDVLKEAKEAGASDVHVTVGLPPKMRLNGKLIPMESYGKMLPPNTLAIVEEIMTEKQREKLDEN
ncbi:MAG: type IV pili twitching motility protein PilT, partial [Butyrivibrio sp.]|nr:type IV pili twitching motility protein PilT [Butyrivibrio sp.]